jgi:hypothetical protein
LTQLNNVLPKPTQTYLNRKPVFLSTSFLHFKTKKYSMETKAMHDNNPYSNLFLTGAIFLANVDVSGLTDYAIKATVGGAIWLGYKLMADYIDRKRNNK